MTETPIIDFISDLSKIVKKYESFLNLEHRSGKLDNIIEKNYYESQENLLTIYLDKLLTIKTNLQNSHSSKRESRERYRLITENANDLIAILNQEFKYEYVNEKAFQEIMGRTKENMVGKNVLHWVHPEDIDKCTTTLKLGFEKGEAKIEARFKKSNNRYIWLEVKGKTFIDVDGKQKGLIISRDITKNKEAEQKLKESEERYRLLFENMNAGFAYHKVIVDKDNNPIDYRYLEVNPAFERLTTMKKENLIGKKVTEAIPGTENDPADWIGKFGNIGLTGIPLTVEDYSEAMDRWYEVSGYSPKIGYFAVTFTNITERMKTMEKLKESEEKYRNLFESIRDGIVMTDLEGKLLDCNQSFMDMLSYDKEELLEKNIQDLVLEKWHENENNRIVEEQVLVRGYSDEYEKEYITKNGKILPVSLKIWLVEDRDKNQIGFWAIVRDITEKKAAEKELIKLNKLKSEILTRSSHELKTPLLAIRGFIDLLLMRFGGSLDPQALPLIENIKHGSIRLETLVRNILVTAELESGVSFMQKTKDDLISVIKESLEELNGIAESRNHLIHTELFDKYSLIFDRVQIKEVFNNLFLNAIKYTPPNGIITIRSEIEDKSIIISIEDNGVGLTKEEKSIIFQRFGKIERFGQGFDVLTEGSGLGLYYSRKVLEMHDGEIGVESAGREKGSTFHFKLPIE